MVVVWGDIIWPPHCATPAAVKANKNQKCVDVLYLIKVFPNWCNVIFEAVFFALLYSGNNGNLMCNALMIQGIVCYC